MIPTPGTLEDCPAGWKPAPLEPRGTTRGFTLLEVLLTMAILASIMAMVGGVLVAVLTSEEKAHRLVHAEKIGSGLMNLLVRDLQAMYVYDIPMPLADNEDGDTDEIGFVASLPPLLPAAGVEGSGAGAEPAGGTAPAASDGSEDELDLRPRILTIGYRLQDSDTHAGLRVLFRREAQGPAANPLEGGQGMEVYDRVKSLGFRFFDATAKEWVDHWEKAGEMPRAVEVTLTIAPEFDANLEGTDEGDDRLKTFKTVVRILVDSATPDPQESGPGPSPGG